MWQPIWNWFLEPVNHNLLLGISIALGFGLILGTRISSANKGKKDKTLESKGDQSFFKGIQYILSNDRDHAIEEFTKSVKVNSDTIETYVALGNLYRSRGNIDRAIRIRQSIILRPNVSEPIRLRALFDMGLDYLKGGFLNRALKTFQKVLQKKPSDVETLEYIEKIYEELKDWENAFKTREKLARLAKRDQRNILAHYLVEAGKANQQNGELSRAASFFDKAISTYNQCVDAYLHLGDLYFDKQDYKKAVSTWKKVSKVSPKFAFLAYGRLEGAYTKMKNLKPVEEFLTECLQANPDAFTHMALARFLYNKNDVSGALREITDALEMDPLLWEARKFKGEILLAHGKEPEALVEYKELIDHLNVPSLKFQCEQCGFQPKDLQWQCSQCKQWDTIHLLDHVGT